MNDKLLITDVISCHVILFHQQRRQPPRSQPISSSIYT